RVRDEARIVVVEQRYHRHERRQCAADFARAHWREATFAAWRDHETDRIDPKRGGGERVFDPHDAAEFYAHSHVRKVTSSGKPYCGGYNGRRNVRPCGGAVGPASARSRPSSNCAIQASGCSPRPIGKRLPTMLRTM